MPETDIKLDDLTPDELIKAIELAGLKVPFDRYIKSETDRAISRAIQTRTSNLDKEKKSLEERLAELENKINTQNKDTAIKAALKEAGLSQDFASLIKANDPEGIKAECETLKKAIDQSMQSQIDTRLTSGELAPVKKGSMGNVETAMIDEFVKTKQSKNVKPAFEGGRFVIKEEGGTNAE